MIEVCNPTISALFQEHSVSASVPSATVALHVRLPAGQVSGTHRAACAAVSTLSSPGHGIRDLQRGQMLIACMLLNFIFFSLRAH